jgi:hypothetical protein
MVSMERRLVGPKHAHPIGTSNPRQRKPAQLNQVTQTMALACEQDVSAGPVVIDECKPQRLINDDSDVEWGQITVDETGKMQTADFASEGA